MAFRFGRILPTLLPRAAATARPTVSRFSLRMQASMRLMASQTDPPATTIDSITSRAIEWHDRGLDRWNRGDVAGALEAFEKSIWTKPTSDALYNMGNCHYVQGQHDKAVDRWNESLKLQPRADAHVNIANIHALVKRDLQSALPHYRAALDIAPEDGEIHYNYACVLDACSAAAMTPESASSPEHDNAMQHLEEAISHYQLAKKYGVEQAEKNLRNALAKLVGKQASNDSKPTSSDS